jgi:hypothetical protein
MMTNNEVLLRQLLDGKKKRLRHLVLMVADSMILGLDTAEPERWVVETRQAIAAVEAELTLEAGRGDAGGH